MPFFYKTFGEKPTRGGASGSRCTAAAELPKRVNDQQWENQKKLYTVEEGIYLAPRAPTNTWNLWHEAHIDRLFTRLIEDLIVLEGREPEPRLRAGLLGRRRWRLSDRRREWPTAGPRPR